MKQPLFHDSLHVDLYPLFKWFIPAEYSFIISLLSITVEDISHWMLAESMHSCQERFHWIKRGQWEDLPHFTSSSSIMLCILTKLPARNPAKPRTNKNVFLSMSTFPIEVLLKSSQYVRVWIIGGAINANVDELIEPTKLMNKSSLGIIDASVTKNKTNVLISQSNKYF